MAIGEPSVRPIIGLEIHVQLATRTKMFCRCAVEFGAPPNTRVCPACLGLPGALPVINRRAVELAVMTGLALNCRIASVTKWDRKGYFYPDLPKNYQISQYDMPIATDGYFELPLNETAAPKQIRIRRAHLEEDAGRNVHDRPGFTGVDLNRAGTPLLEIVTEPDLSSAEEAHSFSVELQRLVTYLGVSEGNMQKGEMRFEPNVNLAIRDGDEEYITPISEIKNLNSFRSLRDAVAYEIGRQLEEWMKDHGYVLSRVGKVNCGWRDDAGRTEIQRAKEEAHDYRYFPDPDLVPVTIDAAWLGEIRTRMPELPAARRERLQRVHGLSVTDTATIVSDRASADLFDAALAAGAEPATLGRQFLSFWARHANARGVTVAGLGIEAGHLAELSCMTAEGKINSTAAQAISERMLTDGRRPQEIARSEGLEQLDDAAAIEGFVRQAIAENPKAVADYRAGGKKAGKALGFLQGRVMQLSRGSAPPRRVGELLERLLGA